MPQRREKPWWLSGGTEICCVCLQPLAYGAGRRCSACDDLICACCAAENGSEVVCAPCTTGDCES